MLLVFLHPPVTVDQSFVFCGSDLSRGSVTNAEGMDRALDPESEAGDQDPGLQAVDISPALIHSVEAIAPVLPFSLVVGRANKMMDVKMF